VSSRLALGAGAVIAGLLAGWIATSGPEPGAAAPGQEMAEVAARGAAPGGPATRPLPPLPASLSGTEADGGLVVDGDARFVVTPDALDLFDYFLAASGEEPLAVIRARIEREIERRLPPDARPFARDLLARYLAYREALRDLYENEHWADRSLERRFQRIRELRRAHFDAAEREALFATEEARWRVDLERRRIATDPDLAPDERAARLAALEAELPEEIRETRRATLAALRLRADEASLRADGASDAEIHALRADRFGPEAAARLAALDDRRARWNERVEAWRSEREQLVAAGVTAEEIASRRAERFEGPERLRIEAIERMEASR
jgi:lipase chaperone LimK